MDYIINLIYEYGLIAMFFLIMIEYACFPVSSEFVLPFCGAVASLSQIHFYSILSLSVLAGLLGTSFCFFIGRFGGNLIINKMVTRFPKTKKSIDNSYKKFEKYGSYAVCFGRLIPICRTYIAFIAGAVKQNYITFLFSSLVGITIWNTLLLGFGYVLRDNWHIVSEYYTNYKHLLNPIVIIVILILILRSKFIRKLILNKKN